MTNFNFDNFYGTVSWNGGSIFNVKPIDGRPTRRFIRGIRGRVDAGLVAYMLASEASNFPL